MGVDESQKISSDHRSLAVAHDDELGITVFWIASVREQSQVARHHAAARIVLDWPLSEPIVDVESDIEHFAKRIEQRVAEDHADSRESDSRAGGVEQSLGACQIAENLLEPRLHVHQVQQLGEWQNDEQADEVDIACRAHDEESRVKP